MTDTCIICCENIRYYTIFKNCQHRNTCWKCTLTNREFNENYQCCFCRSFSKEVVLSDHPLEQYPDVSRLDFDRVYDVHVTSKRIMCDIKNLRKTKCKFCGVHPPSKDALQKHYRHTHKKSLCPHCLLNRKVFLSDQKIYNVGEELEQHLLYGEPDDTYGYIDGHPICLFCNIRFYGEDELKIHIRELPHFECFICVRSGIPLVYYRDYMELQKHFEDKHFICPHRSCKELVDGEEGVKAVKRFVFARNFELDCHLKTHHGKKRKNINIDLQQLMKDEEQMIERSLSPDPTHPTNDNGTSSSTTTTTTTTSSSSSFTHSNNNNNINGSGESAAPGIVMGEVGADRIVFVGVKGRASMGRRHGMDIKDYLSESEFQEFSGKFFKYKNQRSSSSNNNNNISDKQSTSHHHHHHHHHHYRHNHAKNGNYHLNNNNRKKKKKNFRGKRDPFLRRVISDNLLDEIEYKILEVSWNELLTGKLKAVDFYIRFKELFSHKTLPKPPRSSSSSSAHKKRGKKFHRNQYQRYRRYTERDVVVEEEEEEEELPMLTEVYFPEILESIQDPKVFEAIKAAKSTCENKEYQNAIRSKFSKHKKEKEERAQEEQKKRTKITDENFPQLKSSAGSSHHPQHHHSKYSSWPQPSSFNKNNSNNNGQDNKKKKKNNNKKKKKKNKKKGGGGQNNVNWLKGGGGAVGSGRRSDPLRDLQKRDNNPMGGITITVKKKKKKR